MALRPPPMSKSWRAKRANFLTWAAGVGPFWTAEGGAGLHLQPFLGIWGSGKVVVHFYLTFLFFSQEGQAVSQAPHRCRRFSYSDFYPFLFDLRVTVSTFLLRL